MTPLGGNGIPVAENYFYVPDQNMIRGGRFNQLGEVDEFITTWTTPSTSPGFNP